MKLSLFLFLFGIQFLSHAQLVNDLIKENYPTRYYFESQRMLMFRSLAPNEDFLNTPLQERANEQAIGLWSQQLGICLGLSKHLYLDGGVAWMQNGEAYEFADLNSDSTYNYQSRYRYISMPLQLKLTFGNQIKFYGGIGLIPSLYQNYRQDIQWTNALGAQYDDKITINNAMNSFILSYITSGGLDIQLDQYYNLRLGMIYRAQFTNSYGLYEDYIHKSKGWGFQFGFSKKL